MKYLCVFGNPIKHSLSPLIHNFVLARLRLPFVYGRFCLQNGENLKNTFFRLHLSGANVTVPFKEYAFNQADELDSLAKDIGAVNTLLRLNNGKLKGYNTDGIGFLASISNLDTLDFNANTDIAKNAQNPLMPFSSALILGAGGSAKAIACVLKKYGFRVQVANRSNSKREFYASRDIDYLLFSDLARLVDSSTFDIVINATSASLQGELPLENQLLATIFTHSKLAYDLMYANDLTPFLALAKDSNIAYKDGKDMLLWQAAFALAIFCPSVAESINPAFITEARNNTLISNEIKQIFALMSQAIL